MNGVDVRGVVRSGSVVRFLVPIFVFVGVIRTIEVGLGMKVFIIAIIAIPVNLLVNAGVDKVERVRIRALVSEHYQVKYPLSTPLPGRGGSIEVMLEGKDDDAESLKVYESVVAKRSEDNIVTLWVPKTEGDTEFVELGSESGASEYAEQE